MNYMDKRIYIPTLEHQNLETVQRFDQAHFFQRTYGPMLHRTSMLLKKFPEIVSTKTISDHELMLYFFARKGIKNIEDCYQYYGLEQEENNTFGVTIQSLLANQCCLVKSVYERRNHSENPMVWDQIKMEFLCQIELMEQNKQLSVMNYTYYHFEKLEEKNEWAFVQETVSPKELKKVKPYQF